MSRTQQEEQNDHECELAAWELLQDAKATADHWMQKAKEAEQAAADLKAEVKDWKKEYAAERALADQLAEGLRKMVLYSEALILRIQDRSDINFKTLNEGIDLFNEWKEARSE